MFSSALKSFTSNISSNYTISPTPSSTSGAWKVYDGKKKSTGKAVSVFIFEKKSLEPQSGGLGGRSSGAMLKKLHDEVISRVKKECNLLARLRHPSILELAEPIEDTRSGGLMFATEPVTASLAGLLQEKDDQDGTGGVGGRTSRYILEESEGQKTRRELEIDELEIQKGLLQIAQGLEFLHESASLVHGNLTPDAIYINIKSDWKIAGLSFAGPTEQPDKSNAITPISLSEALYHDPRLPSSLQLNLNYTSPDFALDSTISPSADMFSLGILIIALYNSPHTSPLKTNSTLANYKKIMTTFSAAPSPSNNFLCSRPLPRELVSDVLPRLITRRPGQRMNAREFQQSQFFDNILVSSIRFLDSLPAKTPNEKTQFLRGLPRILDQFPKSVLEKKVLPALLEETKDKELLSMILANVFKIIKILPTGKRAFMDKVIKYLRDIFLTTTSGKTGSVERDPTKEAGLVVVLENMELIGGSCTGKEFKDDILPILQLGLESPTNSIIDKSLGCLSTVLSVLDFSTIKNELFPVVAAVFSKTNSLGIKIRGLEAFVIFCGGLQNAEGGLGDGLGGAPSGANTNGTNSSAILNKYTIQEKVVPLLKAIKTREPTVMMAALKVFRQVGKIADADFLAFEVLPLLWSFSLGPLLNLEQFEQFMSIIKALSSKIEQEQTRKLRELSSNTNGDSAALRSTDLMGDSPCTASNMGSDVGENDFERLVLGKSSGRGDGFFGKSLRPQPQRAQSAQAAPIFSWSTPVAKEPQILTPALTSTSPYTSSLNPSLNTNFQAITPDQQLHSFTSLKPTSTMANISANGTLSSFHALTPMQTSPNPWSSSTTSAQSANQYPNNTTQNQSSIPWTYNSATNAMVPQWQKNLNPQSGFSIPPPPASTNFPSFSIPPPPVQPQRGWNPHPKFGGNSSAAGQATPFSTAPQQKPKVGIDAYESLL